MVAVWWSCSLIVTGFSSLGTAVWYKGPNHTVDDPLGKFYQSLLWKLAGIMHCASFKNPMCSEISFSWRFLQ